MRVVDIPEEVYDLFRTGGSSLEDGAFREEDIEAAFRKSSMIDDLKGHDIVFFDPVRATKIPAFALVKNSTISLEGDEAYLELEGMVIFFLDKIQAVLARILAEEGEEEEEKKIVHRLSYVGLHPWRYCSESGGSEKFLRRETPYVVIKKCIPSSPVNFPVPHPLSELPDHPDLRREVYYRFSPCLNQHIQMGFVYLDGDELIPNLRETPEPLTPTEMVRATMDAMKTCSEAFHLQGFVHGDFKPYNILPIPSEDGIRGALADYELVTKEGASSQRGHGFSVTGTELFLDVCHYEYLSYSYSWSGDVFAAGISLIAAYVPRHDSTDQLSAVEHFFKSFFANLKRISEYPTSQNVLKALRKTVISFSSVIFIPDDLLQVVAPMLAYERYERPTMQASYDELCKIPNFEPENLLCEMLIGMACRFSEWLNVEIY